MRRLAVLGVAVLAAGAVGAALAFAQGAPPTVAVSIGPNGVTFPNGAPQVNAGPTTFQITNRSRSGSRDPSVSELKPNVTPDQVQAVLPDLTENNVVDKLKPLLSIQGGVTVAGGATASVTVNLEAGKTYSIDNGDDNDPKIATFSVGQQSNTAIAPSPDATVTMRDFRFQAPSTLSRNGTLRVRNQGETLHIAIAFRVRRGVTSRAALRVARSGSESAFGRAFTGEPVTLQSLVSPGGSSISDVKFSRPGRYVMVCFLADGTRRPHNTLGMERAFRVR
jgi:hypothetical protein